VQVQQQYEGTRSRKAGTPQATASAINASAPHLPPLYVQRSISKSPEKEIKAEEDHQRATYLKTSPERQVETPPKYDVQHQSICFFVNLFCLQGTKLYSFPVLDFVPSLLQETAADSPLELAATAVSRMTLADHYSGKDIRLQTGREYGDALARASKSIRDPSKAISDETIMAVWLLGTYEAIHAVLTHRRMGFERTLEEEWQSHISHIRGAMHLLKLRGASQLGTARGEKIYRIFKAAIQMRLFALNSVTSREFGDMEVDIWKEEHEFVPSKTANTATAFFHRVARLIERAKAFIYSERPPENNVFVSKQTKQLIRYGEAQDEQMKDWSKHEDYWDLMPVQGPVSGTTWALYPSLAQSWFFSPWVYLYWIRFLLARVKLYEALIELVNTDPANLGPKVSEADKLAAEYQVASYRTRLQAAASELIGLTAYAIGDVSNRGTFNSAASGKHPGRTFQEINVVAALQLILPLKACLRSPYTTADQKGAIDLAITHVGDGFRRQPLNLS
jgi:hypothetical protein